MTAQAEDNKFLDLTMDCFLTQHVKDPTRGNNILDLILSNNPSLIDEVTVSEPLSNSDHNTIHFNIVCDNKKNIWKKEYFDYKNGNYADLRKFLETIDWKVELQEGDVNFMWNKFKIIYNKARDTFIPKKNT